MTTTPREFNRLPSLATFGPLALCVLALAWTFWPTLAELAYTWNTNQQYGHGWLVPVFAAYLLYHRRDKLSIQTMQPSYWGLALLAAALGMRLGSTYMYFHAFEQLSLIPAVAGLTLLLGGWSAVRWAWPSLLFLFFMIPLPFSIATAMAGPLQSLATISATFIMQTMGLPAVSEGNIILLNEHQIGIVEACSGLRMLVVFFALSTGVVLISSRHWIDKTIIFLSAVPIALLANLVRITATGVLYSFGLGEMANHFFHDVAGWVMMPLALAMLWVEIKILDALFIDQPQASSLANALPQRATTVPAPRVPRVRRKPTEPEIALPEEQPVESSK
jgi:exosortase